MIVIEYKRLILILKCKKKEAKKYYKTVKVPGEDLSSLTNSAINVELVYIILLGINTIIENRTEMIDISCFSKASIVSDGKSSSVELT